MKMVSFADAQYLSPTQLMTEAWLKKLTYDEYVLSAMASHKTIFSHQQYTDYCEARNRQTKGNSYGYA